MVNDLDLVEGVPDVSARHIPEYRLFDPSRERAMFECERYTRYYRLRKRGCKQNSSIVIGKQLELFD